VLRYYIAAKLNRTSRKWTSIPDDFIARVNSDLIGKYVNIASRCAGFISKKFGGKLGAPQFSPEIAAAYSNAAAEIAAFYEAREYGKAASQDHGIGRPGKQYVEQTKQALGPGQAGGPGSAVDTPVLDRARLVPRTDLVPQADPASTGDGKAEKLLNVEPMVWAEAWKPLAAGHQINAYSHLMARVDPKLLDVLLPPEEAAEPAPAKPAAKRKRKTAAKPRRLMMPPTLA